jgi:hypothetical protein
MTVGKMSFLGWWRHPPATAFCHWQPMQFNVANTTNMANTIQSTGPIAINVIQHDPMQCQPLFSAFCHCRCSHEGFIVAHAHYSFACALAILGPWVLCIKLGFHVTVIYFGVKHPPLWPWVAKAVLAPPLNQICW